MMFSARIDSITSKALSAACAVAISLCLIPSSAFADVRESDIVGSRTVGEAGIADADAPSISAKYAYVVDQDGNVYFQRDSDHQTNIASITKIMTAAVALDAADPDFMVTVSSAAASIGESTACLQAGDTLTLKDAIVGLMVPSGNDAATAIAESVGHLLLDGSQGAASDDGDSSAAYDAFVAKMNSTAAEIGCENTLFTNPHGLDINEFSQEMHSTARDVATFSAYAMQSQVFRDVVAGGDATITVRRGDADVSIELASTDLLIGNYEGACGIKTGFTDTAGSCFAGACQRNGSYLYAIVLGSPDNDQRFVDARAIFDWVYGSEQDLAVANTEVTVGMDSSEGYADVPVIAYVAHDDWLDRTFPVTLADPQATISVSSIFGNVSQDVVIESSGGSISVGDVVGRIDLYQHNELIGSQELVACESVKAPGVFDSISIAFQRLFSGGSDNGSARTEICNEMPILIKKA